MERKYQETEDDRGRCVLTVFRQYFWSFRSTDLLACLMLSFIFQCPYNVFEYKYFNTVVSLFWFRFCFQFQMLFSMTKSSMMRVHIRTGSTGRLTCVICVPALCFMSVD